MAWVIAFLSITFYFLAFIINANNAPSLLSGYNTLNEEEKKNFKLEEYLLFFKKFHLFLGTTILIFGLMLQFAVSENYAGVFVGVYPILAYIFFFIKSNQYVQKKDTKWIKFSVGLMVLILAGMIVLFGLGTIENKFVIHNDKIEIKGIYSETILL
jgi:hypothetical protein